MKIIIFVIYLIKCAIYIIYTTRKFPPYPIRNLKVTEFAVEARVSTGASKTKCAAKRESYIKGFSGFKEIEYAIY